MGCNEVPVEAFVSEQPLRFVSSIAHDDGVIGGTGEERIHASMGFDDQCPRFVQHVKTITGPSERLRVHFIPTCVHHGDYRCTRFEGPIGYDIIGLNFQTVDGDEGNALGVANAFCGGGANAQPCVTPGPCTDCYS